MRLLFTYLACVFLGGISVNASAQNKVIFEDDFNKSKKFEKNWYDNSTEEETGKIEYKKTVASIIVDASRYPILKEEPLESCII